MISSDLFERAKKLIPGGVNSPVRAFRSVGGAPFFVKAAHGATLTTADDRELIDFVCTWGPAIHGHNHPVIRDAIAAALNNGTSFGTPNPYEVEMAELITTYVPSIEKVRMCNSGTEATMSAIRLARGFTGRDKIIKFAGCYHGHSDSLLIKAGSGALTHGHPDSAGVPASFAQETIVLPFNDRDALTAAFSANPDAIAGVILEPYPANVGLIRPDEGYLRFLRELTAQHGTVLIFDEVMTGFRLAKGGVQEIEAITPDLTTLGKIIGGGLPVGAFGGRADIMDRLAPEGPVYQAGTLSGNPLAMAAGIAALKLLADDEAYARLARLGAQVQSAVAGALAAKGIAAQVPQTGSMWCTYFTDQPVRDLTTAQTTDAELFARYFRGCLDQGVYLPPSAYEACFISTAHEGAVIDKACEIMTDVIKTL
ncbi:glutamate-1-semialdehyde 2,1-aminomutase [Synoicihabitans lomoniglobus]|uniref:Glutamate-1-semialdehyde 2,1-aminomutase n=1 Tax=Synoicihabitans lomoniglobus TaxID=2909285 RepID=A0AAF0CRM7_9BACT|nr:glutamate-1-semialdehyde 2,1-aminomutase [Opitutaceae bacterium LMO-M01]WED66790.1 glutamate-1-semialdehyde 2,1-aminomutase [Opitutaceae bacterium LMO-M01]